MSGPGRQGRGAGRQGPVSGIGPEEDPAGPGRIPGLGVTSLTARGSPGLPRLRGAGGARPPGPRQRRKPREAGPMRPTRGSGSDGRAG